MLVDFDLMNLMMVEMVFLNSQNQLAPIVFQSKRNMPHFRKLVFISPAVIESHSFESFEKICGNGLVAVDWFLPLSVEALGFE